MKCRINLRPNVHELRGKSNGTSPVCRTIFLFPQLFVFFVAVAQLSSRVISLGVAVPSPRQGETEASVLPWGEGGKGTATRRLESNKGLCRVSLSVGICWQQKFLMFHNLSAGPDDPLKSCLSLERQLAINYFQFSLLYSPPLGRSFQRSCCASQKNKENPPIAG